MTRPQVHSYLARMATQFLLATTAALPELSAAACPVDSSAVGTVKARIVGIEVRSGCTYLLLTEPVATIALDTNPFLAGRFHYLAIESENPQYRYLLATAHMALALNLTVFAEYVSRFGRVSVLSASRVEAPL